MSRVRDAENRSSGPIVSRWLKSDTLCYGLGVLSVALYCLIALQQLTATATDRWSQEVLLSAYLVRDGKHLYYYSDKVPALTTMYGPFTYYMLLPITFLKNPSAAIHAASVLSDSIYVLPIVALLWMSRSMRKCDLALTISVFLGVTLYYGYVSTTMGVGIGGLAVIAASSAAKNKTRRNEIAALVLPAIAFLTKQVMIPLIAVYPLLIFRAYGVRAFARASLRMVFVSIGLLILMLLINDPKAMYFNMIWLPAHQGWYSVTCLTTGSCPPDVVALTLYQKLHTFVWVCMKLLINYDYLLLWTALITVLLWRNRTGGKTTVAQAFCLAGLLLAPTSVMNMAKLGGVEKNAIICVYMLFMAASASALELLSGGTTLSTRQARSAVLVVISIPLWIVLCRFIRDPTIGDIQSVNPTNSSYDVLRKSGSVYFPWYPLSTYLTTGRVYHSPQAFNDRATVGIYADIGYIRRGLPQGVSLFAYHSKEEIDQDSVLRFCDVAPNRDQLPGWTVFDCSKLLQR